MATVRLRERSQVVPVGATRLVLFEVMCKLADAWYTCGDPEDVAGLLHRAFEVGWRPPNELSAVSSSTTSGD